MTTQTNSSVSSEWKIKIKYDDRPTALPSLVFFSPISLLTLLVLALSLLGDVGASLAWFLVIVWTLRGVNEAVEGILLSFLLVFINPSIFTVISAASTLRWAVLGLATIRIGYRWLQSGLSTPPWFGYSVLFLIVGGIGLITTRFPVYSGLKLVSYFIGSTVIFLGIWLGEKRNWGSTILTLGSLLVLMSLPLLGVPNAYFINPASFQGVFNQPQAYGIIMGTFFIFILIAWTVDQPHKLTLFELFVLAALLVTVVLSRARIGLLLMVLGLFFGLLTSQRHHRWLIRLLTRPLTYLAIIILIAGIGIYSENINAFIFKTNSLDADSGVVDPRFGDDAWLNLVLSRQPYWQLSWNNFLEHPIIGIGFGAASDPGSPLGVSDPSAEDVNPYTSEKTLIVTALLEEVGLAGSVIFALLLFSQISRLKNSLYLAPIVLFFAAFFINFGEMVYFSIGGIGAFVHICMAYALATAMKNQPEINP